MNGYTKATKLEVGMRVELTRPYAALGSWTMGNVESVELTGDGWVPTVTFTLVEGGKVVATETVNAHADVLVRPVGYVPTYR